MINFIKIDQFGIVKSGKDYFEVHTLIYRQMQIFI